MAPERRRRHWGAPLLALLALAGGAVAKQHTERERLAQALVGNEDGVLKLKSGTLSTLGKPTEDKPYALAIFFTARHLEHKQGLGLPKLKADFSAVAQSHRREHGRSSQVFFAQAEFNDAQSVFQTLGVESLPHMLVLPHRALPLASDGRRVNVSSELRLTERSLGLNKDGIAQLVEEISGQGVKSVRADSIRDSAAFPLLVLALLALAGLVAYKAYHSKALRTVTPWMCASLAVYWFSVSGSMFTIIRNVPMFTLDPKTGKKSFFTSQFGVQLGAEGLYIGGLYLAAALSAVLVTHYAPRINNWLVQRLVGYSAGAVAAYAATTATKWYSTKSGYGIRAVGFDELISL